MKRMLINATQPEELRVAIVDGQTLHDLDIEVPSREQKKSNIYKGRITRVEPSLEAAFVDFGVDRHGFLPLKEVSKNYFSPKARKIDGRIPIREAIKEGQEIILQVEKEERGNKGAALTTFISLAGRYLVLMPNNPRSGGISRRIQSEERDHLRNAMADLTVPEGMGLIARTAGVGRDAEELQWDLDNLLNLWKAIDEAGQEKEAPFLIYQESNLIIRALRDYLRSDIGEILIDRESVYKDAREFMQSVMPHNLNKLKFYSEHVPLFSKYQIESQIESAFNRQVRLPSGGSIVIDHTEALLSIDINSSRATKGSDIEETALNTNLEAADEVARQLRIRDLGGLVVIDFIDMSSNRHQREVEERLKLALKLDRARVQTGRISRFGLLEMSRQRIRPSLGESSQIVCPRCVGHGFIRGIESLALSVLRIIEEEVMKDGTGKVIAHVPVDIANFLQNEKRQATSAVELRHKVPIMIIAQKDMTTPQYEIQRLRVAEAGKEEAASYDLNSSVTPNDAEIKETVQPTPIDKPAVSTITPNSPVPQRAAEQPPSKSLFAKLWEFLFGKPDTDTQTSKPQAQQHSGSNQRSRNTNRPKRYSKNTNNRSQNARRNNRQNTKTQPEGRQSSSQENSSAATKKISTSQGIPSSQNPEETTENTSAKPSNRRGRRGGRRRKPQDAVSQENQNSSDSTPIKTPPESKATPEASESTKETQRQVSDKPDATDIASNPNTLSSLQARKKAKSAEASELPQTTQASPATTDAEVPTKTSEPVESTDDADNKSNQRRRHPRGTRSNYRRQNSRFTENGKADSNSTVTDEKNGASSQVTTQQVTQTTDHSQPQDSDKAAVDQETKPKSNRARTISKSVVKKTPTAPKVEDSVKLNPVTESPKPVKADTTPAEKKVTPKKVVEKSDTDTVKLNSQPTEKSTNSGDSSGNQDA